MLMDGDIKSLRCSLCTANSNACDVYNVCDVHVAFMYVMELLSILNNRRRLLTLFLGPAFLAAYYKAK